MLCIYLVAQSDSSFVFFFFTKPVKLEKYTLAKILDYIPLPNISLICDRSTGLLFEPVLSNDKKNIYLYYHVFGRTQNNKFKLSSNFILQKSNEALLIATLDITHFESLSITHDHPYFLTSPATGFTALPGSTCYFSNFGSEAYGTIKNNIDNGLVDIEFSFFDDAIRCPTLLLNVCFIF